MLKRRTVLALGAAVAASAATSAAWADDGIRLLLVHGRSQQGKNPQQLKAEWLEALRVGVRKTNRRLADDVEVAFPFYGDVLDDFTRQADIPLTSDIQTKGSDPDDGFLAFEAEFAESLRQGAGITDAEVDAEYGTNPKPKGPQNWEWVQAVLRTIDKKGGGLSQAALEQFMRDVFLYTTRVRVREEIDRIVRAELTDKPTVVIGHSLGSVVTYSVLTSDPRALRVPLYVTVGSPLAVRPIRKAFQPLKAPPNVAAWYNAFDKRDVVALYPLDERNFAVTPAVQNYDGVRNKTRNRHGIVGYLDDERVAGRVMDTLGA